MTMISSPTTRPCSPSAAHACTSSHASGAPSDPCLGASLRSLSTDQITPAGRSRALTNAVCVDLALMWVSLVDVRCLVGYFMGAVRKRWGERDDIRPRRRPMDAGPIYEWLTTVEDRSDQPGGRSARLGQLDLMVLNDRPHQDAANLGPNAR